MPLTPLQAQDKLQPGQPLTVAESSDFQATCQSAEVIEFLDACANHADHVTRFDWGETVEGRPMPGVVVSTSPYQLGQQDQRNVILLLGNIHSGECCGKEALLMMLRDLTHSPEHPWLKDNVILIAPNYNADGNDRMGKNNRPGQAGPAAGMGRRENAQGLDLNRDFCKIESPEARALVKLIDQVNPHIFVDCHTTDGSRHQYQLTYDIPHNPATSAAIRTFLRQKMMPEVTEALADEGTLTFYYGNFNRDFTSWTTYGHEPRYSTEYVGLRGRLGILSEAYSYLDYEGRIKATKAFCSSILDYATKHRDAIHQLLDAVDSEWVEAANKTPERLSVALGARAIPFEEPFMLKGFKDGEPFDYECQFVGNYEPTLQVPLPYAYLVPAEQARVVDRLLMHGVTVEQLTKPATLEVEVDTVANLTRNPRAFQRHFMVRVESHRESRSVEVPAGQYVIRTAQPLGRLVAYLLESESDDGFAFWNFFDDVLEVGQPYPVRRLPAPAELPTESIEQVTPVGRLKLDDIDGPRQLFATAPKSPEWVGQTHLLKSEINGREFLLDAATVSFVDRPARPYRAAEVRAVLEEVGFEGDVARAISSAGPIVPTTNAAVVLAAEGHAVLLRVSDGESLSQDDVLILGTPEAQAELFHFDQSESMLAMVVDGVLQFVDLDSQEVHSLDRENDQHLLGKLDWVYQEELYGRGNFKGYWWQPGGQQVAFLKLDESPLIPFTVMDHLPVHGKSEETNYPKAGDPNPVVSVGVVSAKDPGQVTWLDLSRYGDEELLVSAVTWSADGQQLMVQVQNREQTWLDLVAANANGSDVRVLFRDQTPAWIESPGDPVLLPGGDFLWRSPRTGYSHLYRYNAAGEMVDAVTEGEWEVRSLEGVDTKGKYAYFTATKDTPLEIHAYRVDLQAGNIQRLTERGSDHSVSCCHDFAYFIDNSSTVSDPGRTTLRDNTGKLVRELAVRSDDRWQYIQQSTPEFLTVDSGNDQPLDAMLIKPIDFDPNKKYPVLVHIYAGPQAPRVRNRFGGDWYLWHQMLAQQGYVIWMCDNQSASYRSVRHAWPIHQDLASGELADIERGVDWLREQSWVDGDRIGIWGWSYGGYMTAFALTHSDSFCMGISGAPVTDWKNYDSIYTERYLGQPQTNPEGYQRSSVLGGPVESLHGELLLIHGTIDDNVHLNNSLQFAQELQNAGQQFEMMFYPSNRHSIRVPSQAAHLRKLMTDFVRENL